MNQARRLQTSFEFFTLQQIPRSRNTHANSLATLVTSSTQGLPRVILVEDLHKPTEEKKKKDQVHKIKFGPSWMDSLVLFLKDCTLLKEKGLLLPQQCIKRATPPIVCLLEQDQ